jgi:hypothetical protein
MLSPTLTGNRVVAIRRSVMTLALLASACAASQVEPDILIDGATVIDGTGRAALPDHSVAIQGDRILAIGPA